VGLLGGEETYDKAATVFSAATQSKVIVEAQRTASGGPDLREIVTPLFRENLHPARCAL